MNLTEKHLNWTYGIALVIAIITLAVVGFIYNNAIGYIVYMVVTIVGAELILWRKGRTFEYGILILLPPILAIVALCLSNKRHLSTETVTSELGKKGKQ